VVSQTYTSGRDPFTLSANGQTAGSYTTDGRWNRGGWATYPLAYPLRDDPAFAKRAYSPLVGDVRN
jgi:hypothetical protein